MNINKRNLRVKIIDFFAIILGFIFVVGFFIYFRLIKKPSSIPVEYTYSKPILILLLILFILWLLYLVGFRRRVILNLDIHEYTEKTGVKTLIKIFDFAHEIAKIREPYYLHLNLHQQIRDEVNRTKQHIINSNKDTTYNSRYKLLLEQNLVGVKYYTFKYFKIIFFNYLKKIYEILLDKFSQTMVAGYLVFSGYILSYCILLFKRKIIIKSLVYIVGLDNVNSFLCYIKGIVDYSKQILVILIFIRCSILVMFCFEVLYYDQLVITLKMFLLLIITFLISRTVNILKLWAAMCAEEIYVLHLKMEFDCDLENYTFRGPTKVRVSDNMREVLREENKELSIEEQNKIIYNFAAGMADWFIEYGSVFEEFDLLERKIKRVNYDLYILYLIVIIIMIMKILFFI